MFRENWRSVRANRISLLHESDASYPRALQEIPDPPGVLFYTGDIQPVDAMAIAIVGTRHASYYGKNQAHRLAGGLARAGITIVSGLARGIDAAAHRGALEAGGRTIAITASGVMDIYPPEHKGIGIRHLLPRCRNERKSSYVAAQEWHVFHNEIELLPD